MVNNFYGSNQKTQRGLVGTIDFDLAPVGTNLKTLRNDAQMGTLHLGGKEVKMTVEEVTFLIETLTRAQRAFVLKYKMGV
jgi:hypothetical protein